MLVALGWLIHIPGQVLREQVAAAVAVIALGERQVPAAVVLEQHQLLLRVLELQIAVAVAVAHLMEQLAQAVAASSSLESEQHKKEGTIDEAVYLLRAGEADERVWQVQ